MYLYTLMLITIKNWIKILRILSVLATLIICVLIFEEIEFDDSLENWVPEHSTLIEDYKSFLEEFQTDASIIISIVEDPSSNQRVFLNNLDSLVEKLKKLEHVLNVGVWPPPFLSYEKKPVDSIHSYYLTYLPPSHLNPNRPELVQQITELLQVTGLEFHIAGTGVIYKAINDMTRTATKHSLIIGIALLIVLMVLIIRNARIILKTIFIAIGSISFLFILAWYMNIKFNTIMATLPILILFYSTSTSVHIYNHHGDLGKILKPAVLSVLTTCASFSPFLLDSSRLLRDFGIAAITGLLGGIFWTIVFYYPRIDPPEKEMPITRYLDCVPRYWNKHLLFYAVIFSLALIPGIVRIRSEIDVFKVLPSSNKAVKDYKFIENNVGPIMPVEYQVNIRATEKKTLQLWIDDVVELDEVGASISYLSFPSWLNIEHLGFVSGNGEIGRIVFYVRELTTKEGKDLVFKIGQLADDLFSGEQEIPRPTGYASLYVSVSDHLATSFRNSLLMAFSFVFLILFIYLRNIRLFLAAIFPNLVPILMLLGIMGWFRIPLDMVTFPTGCLVLGIIVDDTIHMLYWYRKFENVYTAFAEGGPGIIVTSIIFIAGFSVFLFSDANPVKLFGVLTITTMIAALYGDIIILPLILQSKRLFSKKQNKQNSNEIPSNHKI